MTLCYSELLIKDFKNFSSNYDTIKHSHPLSVPTLIEFEEYKDFYKANELNLLGTFIGVFLGYLSNPNSDPVLLRLNVTLPYVTTDLNWWEMTGWEDSFSNSFVLDIDTLEEVLTTIKLNPQLKGHIFGCYVGVRNCPQVAYSILDCNPASCMPLQSPYATFKKLCF